MNYDRWLWQIRCIESCIVWPWMNFSFEQIDLSQLCRLTKGERERINRRKRVIDICTISYTYICILLSIQETRLARIFIKEFHAGREIFFFRMTRYRFSIGSVEKVEEGRLFWQTKRRYIYVIGERWIILWNISSDRNRVTLSSLWKRLASI